MTRLRPAFVVVLAGSMLAPAVAQDAPPRFDVASVKKQPAQIPPSPPSGPAPALNATFRRINTTVAMLVRVAYNVTDAQIVGGPDWVRKDLFEVTARAASAISLDGMRPMVASLLAERFNLVLHREQREMRGAVLVMAREDRRRGPKLERCKDPNAPLPAPTPYRIPVGSAAPLQVRCQPISTLVTVASNIMRVPVVDRTDLNGLWSYSLFYASSEPVPEALRARADAENLLPFPAALNDELGLRLQNSNGPFEVLVIDSVQQPTEN